METGPRGSTPAKLPLDGPLTRERYHAYRYWTRARCFQIDAGANNRASANDLAALEKDPARAGDARRAQRKPKFSFWFVGLFLLRLAERTLDGLSLFQLPPRLTRAACQGLTRIMQFSTERKPLPSVVEHAYATWLWLDERVTAFPVHARRHVGHRVLEAVLDALTAVVEASYARPGERRHAELAFAARRLTLARLLLRGARDRRYLSLAQHEHAMRLMDEWGRQVGGWLRSETRQ